MKKFILGALSVVIIIGLLFWSGIFDGSKIMSVFDFTGLNGKGGKTDTGYSYVTEGKIKYRVKAEGNFLYFYKNGAWEKTFIKGVNIGAGKPGLFPGELLISYDAYYRWFQYISEMNINCIRVYTTLRPQFYNALLDFNKSTDTPLFLFQGVWVNEEDIRVLSDVYAQNSKIMSEFLADAKNVVDVLHGNITLPARQGYAAGEYTSDVSEYLAGIILGIEWEPALVKNTDDSNQDKNVYDGTYLYTQSATPFEAFLCNVGDNVIKYQTDKYGLQTAVSFVNWVTTDPLSHPNEPHPDEDLVTVNMENIKSRNTFLPGQFASYHVYPYYPDTMNYQKDYIEYIDEDGKANPYRAYLRDIKLVHTMPVLIAEVGIPTARGMGHESIMGYNQGFVDETEQGEMLLDIMESMYKENLAGGIMFTWQDEWFKRTWNNVAFDIADKRPFWSNIQTNEQCFGIMAFDPGEIASVCYVDGDAGEWEGDSPCLISSAGSLYVKSDERYLYFMAKPDSFDFEKDTLLIPIDITENQGNFSMKDTSATFDKAADFVIQIKGKDNSRIMVDSYYDSFYYLYGEQYKMIPAVADIRKKNSGRFNTMQMCYGYEMTVPPANEVIPFKSYETGKLLYGNANPNAENYKSLSDFYYKDGVLEIKIPWQLLNIMDPSDKKIMDDLYALQSISPTDMSGVYIGMGILGVNTAKNHITLNGAYDWQKWTVPTFHERLKPSYWILQEGLKSLI